MKAMNGIIRYGCEPVTAFATHNDKFPQEKVCFENEAYLIHFDGVILNSASLKESLGCSDNKEILIRLYQTYGAELVFHAKGFYALAFWDKKAQKLLITNDLLSKRPVYYHMDADGLSYAVSYYDLLDLLSGAGYAAEFDMDAIRDMLRGGFLTGSKTYLQHVSFLNAFESLVVDLAQGRAEIVHHPMKKPLIPDSEEGIIDRFDALFSEAVKLQFLKNEEYGYTQCATISGGMDSRACLLKADDLGFDRDIVCFNYAQSGSLDYSISQQIAADLGLDYIHYPMDAAVFLGRLQDAMSLNECMQSGIGATGARTMATLLNTSNFGLINIGICGGELMGDWVRRNRKDEPQNKLLRLIARARNKIRESSTTEAPNAEDYSFNPAEYFNHLRASKNFAHMFIDKCECVSPFMDEDVVMFMLQVNPGLLYGRRMYRKWMCRYLPNSYIITSTGTTVDATYLQELFSYCKYRCQQLLKGISHREMNPIDHWFETQPHHVENCTVEYEHNCSWLRQNGCAEDILCAMEDGWKGSWLPKLYVLTAQRAVRDILDRFGKTV